MFDGYAGVWDFTGIGSATSMGNTISFTFVIIFVRNGTQQLLENTSQAPSIPWSQRDHSYFDLVLHSHKHFCTFSYRLGGILQFLLYLQSVTIPNAKDILLHTNSTWQLSSMVTISCTMAFLPPSFQPPAYRAPSLPPGSSLPAPFCSLIPLRCVVSFGDVLRGVGTGTIRMTPCFREQRRLQPSSQRCRHCLHFFRLCPLL